MITTDPVVPFINASKYIALYTSSSYPVQSQSLLNIYIAVSPASPRSAGLDILGRHLKDHQLYCSIWLFEFTQMSSSSLLIRKIEFNMWLVMTCRCSLSLVMDFTTHSERHLPISKDTKLDATSWLLSVVLDGHDIYHQWHPDLSCMLYWSGCRSVVCHMSSFIRNGDWGVIEQLRIGHSWSHYYLDN